MLNTQLASNEFVAGDFCSVADMAIWPWASLWEGQQQTLDDKPHMARWLATMGARPGVQRGRALFAGKRKTPDSNPDNNPDAHKLLFGQKR